MVAIPKKDCNLLITADYKKSSTPSAPLARFPPPRVDETLDSLGKGRITIDKDSIPLAALCTPTRLFEWLGMPQGSSAAPGWFVKVVNEAIKGPRRRRSSLPR